MLTRNTNSQQLLALSSWGRKRVSHSPLIVSGYIIILQQPIILIEIQNCRVETTMTNWKVVITIFRQTSGIGYFHVFRAVKPSVLELPPWYAFLKEIIPRLPVYKRAIIIANSFASEPEFTKYTTCNWKSYFWMSAIRILTERNIAH